MNKRGDLLHHSLIYKILSSLLYLIAYPILFLVTKLWLGLKVEGRENLSKMGDEYITVANHINMIDCAMIALAIFPRIPYFLTLQRGEIVGIYPEGHLIPYYDGIREFKNGAFNFAVRNQVPILPIVFTYREPEGIIRFIKRKPFITLTILEPEYPKTEISKANVQELKNRVYRKMKLERRIKKLYNEEMNKDTNMQEEKV